MTKTNGQMDKRTDRQMIWQIKMDILTNGQADKLNDKSKWSNGQMDKRTNWLTHFDGN